MDLLVNSKGAWKKLSAISNTAQTLGWYSAVFTILTVPSSLLAKNLTLFGRSMTWADAIFLGLVIVASMFLVTASLLAARRYFKPMPIDPNADPWASAERKLRGALDLLAVMIDRLERAEGKADELAGALRGAEGQAGLMRQQLDQQHENLRSQLTAAVRGGEQRAYMRTVGLQLQMATQELQDDKPHPTPAMLARVSELTGALRDIAISSGRDPAIIGRAGNINSLEGCAECPHGANVWTARKVAEQTLALVVPPAA